MLSKLVLILRIHWKQIKSKWTSKTKKKSVLQNWFEIQNTTDILKIHMF